MDSNDVSKMFHVESEKLENLINHATISELSIHEIVETYYQIMNVSTMSTVLKQQLEDSDENNPLINKIKETQKFISEKFDLNLHPSIMNQLTNSLAETTKTLQSKNTIKKPKDDIETDAKLYEKLRQTMSTKEFVEQYAQGLFHD